MNENHAGSATGIDLADLESTAKEALRDLSHIELHLEQSKAPKTVLNRAVDVRLCIKELQAALARATPQHPADLRKSFDKAFLSMNGFHTKAELAHAWAQLAGELFRAGAAAATPQHSVTEQDEPSGRRVTYVPSRGKKGVVQVTAWGPADMTIPPNRRIIEDLPMYVRAQPLASTAATQPEQASIKTWQERCGDTGPTPSLDQAARAMKAEIADLRAALAIPASTEQAHAERGGAGCDRCDEGWAYKPCPSCAALAIPASTAIRDAALDEAAKHFEADVFDPNRTRQIVTEIRALKGAPASTAASEQQADCTEPNRAACPRLCHDFCNAEEERKASESKTDEWRVGEFWSSANPGKKVHMLARGIDIENFGIHKDFIRWVGSSGAALSGRATIPSEADERVLMTAGQLAAFHRFCECCEDFDSGGYDVDKGVMSELARIGVVRSTGFGRYETTAYGDTIRAALTHRATTATCQPAAPTGQPGDVICQPGATTATPEPIYQVQFHVEQGSSAWHDASEAAYHVTMPERRRIVYGAAAPDTATTAADQQGGLLKCAKCGADRSKEPCRNLQACGMIGTAQQGAAQAQAGDTARLDWLLPNLHPANFGLDFDGGYTWDSEAEYLAKYRKAIDAAMAAPATSKEKA